MRHLSRGQSPCFQSQLLIELRLRLVGQLLIELHSNAVGARCQPVVRHWHNGAGQRALNWRIQIDASQWGCWCVPNRCYCYMSARLHQLTPIAHYRCPLLMVSQPCGWSHDCGGALLRGDAKLSGVCIQCATQKRRCEGTG